MAGGDGNEGEGSPEKNENGSRQHDFFGGVETDGAAQSDKNEVRKNVVVHRDDIESGGLAALDELCEPSVVEVRIHVASFDMSVPEAGNQE